MHGTLSHDEYSKLLNKLPNSYMPPTPKKKKLNLKQIFFLKKKGYFKKVA
tara:strand:+ start:674 stop:823 length:150 start_codon:yes stop_codon:yes gene_type:complete